MFFLWFFLWLNNDVSSLVSLHLFQGHNNYFPEFCVQLRGWWYRYVTYAACSPWYYQSKENKRQKKKKKKKKDRYKGISKKSVTAWKFILSAWLRLTIYGHSWILVHVSECNNVCIFIGYFYSSETTTHIAVQYFLTCY